ncbi:MAG: MFS transporter [Actinomycetes bacterium]
MSVLDRAKVAVAVVFVVNGFAFASWLARLPAIRSGLELTPGQVGLLLLCLSLGTVVALPASGFVVTRLGPARTVGTGAAVVGLGLLGMAAGLAAGSVATVAVGMFVYGAGTSSWDVAMNVEGAEVERALGRTVMPRFHAGFSVGTVAGALLGAASARLDIDLPVQLAATVAIVLVAVPLALRSFTPLAVDHADQAASAGLAAAWQEPRTLLVGAVVLAFALAEGIANDWLALALVDGYGTSEALAAVGFACFVSAMTLGRTFGGTAVDWLGRVTVLRLTGVLVVAGVAVVVWSPVLPGAFVGAALWGLGASLGFPLGMSAAADDEHRAAARVAVVSSIGYAAFLGGPPLLGTLADALGVRQAVVVACVAGLVGALLASATRRETAPQVQRLP